MESPSGLAARDGGGAPSDLPESVLVAEDDMLIARSVREMLEAMNIRVVGLAPNGVRALEIAEKTPPDAAVLDIRMPELDGIEVAKTLWTNRRIPSVLLTAYGSDEYISGAVSANAFGYVLKPVTSDGLRGARRRVEPTERESDRDAAARPTCAHPGPSQTDGAKWRLVELGSMRGARRPPDAPASGADLAEILVEIAQLCSNRTIRSPCSARRSADLSPELPSVTRYATSAPGRVRRS